MTWDPNEAPVDYVELGGRRSPGLAEVIGVDSPRGWDERRGPGLSGARLRFLGMKLSHFMIRLRLYSAEDFAAWEEWRDVVQRPPLGERPRALDIVHPITEDAGVRSVVVANVAGLVQTDDGEWTIEISVIEHRPIVRAAGLVEGSAQSTSDPLDLAIDAERAETDRYLAAAAALEASL